MLQCMCRGEYKPNIVNKMVSIMGIEKVELKNLKVYICNGCGKEIYPEETILKFRQAQQEYYSSAPSQLSTVFR